MRANFLPQAPNELAVLILSDLPGCELSPVFIHALHLSLRPLREGFTGNPDISWGDSASVHTPDLLCKPKEKRTCCSSKQRGGQFVQYVRSVDDHFYSSAA